ncbi:YDG domain-containing protein At5g47160 [Linum perenne]
MLKRKGRWINNERRLGHIPGIEIGDEFGSRAEMVVIGLHREFINGIDTINNDSDLLATCIVATDRYSNNYMGSKNCLHYSGQGGNLKASNGAVVEDQKLTGGNYALRNSIKEKTPLRVIMKKVVFGKTSSRHCQNITLPPISYTTATIDFTAHHEDDAAFVVADNIKSYPPCVANFSEYTPNRS